MKPTYTPGRFANVCRGAFLSFCLCLTVLQAAAQVGRTGITGTVSDTSGAAVAGATVSVTSQSTGVVLTTTSDKAGIYVFRSLIPGLYKLSAQATGFETLVQSDVLTEVDRVSDVDFKLQIGSTSQTVNVEANSSPINTESPIVGNLVTGKEIADIPLNGRNWVSLNLLTPGAARFYGTSMSFSNITESVAPGNFVVNGLRGSNNSYFLDGINQQDVEDFILSVIPPLDSLAEFRTESGNSGAEFTGGAGAMVTAVTKSGTNEIHGSAWEYIRNNALDARNYFATSTPELRRNQYGVTVGGPIRKDRTFFFGAWEGFRQAQGQPYLGSYPTASEVAGNLSDMGATIVDPLTGKPFPGNVIPASRINPLSTSWLSSFIPLPNTNGPLSQGNYVVQRVEPITYDTGVGRIDQRVGEKGNLFGRYIYTLASAQEPTILSSFARTQTRPGEDIAVQYTHQLTPRVVLEGLFGYHLYDDKEPEGNAHNLNMIQALGVQNDPNFSNAAASLEAPPLITVTGLSQFGTSYLGRPREIKNRGFYYNGSVFITLGAHATRMGVNITNNRADFPETIIPTGNWSYTGQFSNSGFGDFLLGYPRSIGVDPDPFNPESRRVWGGGWFQDDWKVNPRLTVNLGLRFDIDTRYISADNSVANFDLSKPPVAVNITPTTRPAGWSRALVDGPAYIWSPRVGFAYKLSDNNVIRAGFGVYWQPMTADPFVNYSINPPFERSISSTIDVTQLPTFDRSLPLASSAASALEAIAIQKNFKDGYIQQWNLTFEHSIGSTLFQVAYVGNTGVQLYQSINVNLTQPGPGPIVPRQPYTQMLVAAGGRVTPGLQPVGGISLQGSGANSNYNALQIKVQRRFTRNLGFTASYAWSKAIDSNDGSGIESYAQTLQQPLNPAAERGLATFDLPQSLTFDYIYALPMGRGQKFLSQGPISNILGGWQLQGITSLQSGTPYTILNAYDNLNNGGSGYPNVACNPNYGRGRSSAQKVSQFFNTSCFVPAGGGVLNVPNYTYGNERRNSVFGPGTNFWSTGLKKNFSFDRVQMQFSSEFFNVFNHTNFGIIPPSVFDGNPNLEFGTAQFGKLFYTAQDAREIQFGLRISF
jgi:hypothetical protein